MKRNDGQYVLSRHHHGPWLEAIHRMNDARCELLITKLFSSFSFVFLPVNHRSDVRSSAMIFQLEPRVGQAASRAKFVVLIARFNTEV